MKAILLRYPLAYILFASCVTKVSNQANRRIQFIDSILNHTVTVNKEVYIDSIPNNAWDRMQQEFIYDSLNQLHLIIDRAKKDSFEYFSTGLFINDAVAWIDLRYTVNKTKVYYTTYYLQDTVMIDMRRKGEAIDSYQSSIKH